PFTVRRYGAYSSEVSLGSSYVTIAATKDAFLSTYFWTSALFLTSKSVFSGSSLSVILFPFTLMIVTTKLETDDGRTCVGDCQPVSVEPSETTVDPIATLSTQKPGSTAALSPSVAGSLNVRNARSTGPL